MSNNWKHLYDNFLPIMNGLLKQYANDVGREFGARYWDHINQNERGAYEMTMRCDDRLKHICGNRNPSIRDATDAAEWVLRDAFAAYQRNTNQSNGFESDRNPFKSGNTSSSQNSEPGAFIDPDLIDTGAQQPAGGTQQVSGHNTTQVSSTAHTGGKSAYMGVTSKDLESPTVEEIPKESFDRRQVRESPINDVQLSSRITYGSAPPISILKARARVPVSDPNVFDGIIRKTFTTDLVGLYWAMSIEYDRIYTLPIPLAEYERLVEEISERTAAEGYTAELIISVLKSCSQATYETMSDYLVQEFNKQSTRFVRSSACLRESITLSNLDGIVAFMNSPPKIKLTENPNAVTRFAQLVNIFFRQMFSRNNCPKNSTTLELDNYATYLHNDSVGMWDSVLGISKYGIPLLPVEKQKDWLQRINSRMTFLSRTETVFVSNIVSPEFISNTGMGHMVEIGNSGEVRTLLSVLRICNYDESTHVSGAVITPHTRNGSALVGNYTLVNPLENPAQVYLARRPNL